MKYLLTLVLLAAGCMSSADKAKVRAADDVLADAIPHCDATGALQIKAAKKALDSTSAVDGGK